MTTIDEPKFQFANLHAQIMVGTNDASVQLLVSATDEQTGKNIATIGSLKVTDPELGVKLQLIAQAFRMGARFGKADL